jgi:hypothetical protein
MRLADHSSRGILPSVMCLSVFVKPRQKEDPGPLWVVAPLEKKIARNSCGLWSHSNHSVPLFFYFLLCSALFISSSDIVGTLSLVRPGTNSVNTRLEDALLREEYFTVRYRESLFAQTTLLSILKCFDDGV